MKLGEQSYVTLGLAIVLCSVAWRGSKVESRAMAAEAKAASIEKNLENVWLYMNGRRDVSDERWRKIEQTMNDIKVDLATLKGRTRGQ